MPMSRRSAVFGSAICVGGTACRPAHVARRAFLPSPAAARRQVRRLRRRHAAVWCHGGEPRAAKCTPPRQAGRRASESPTRRPGQSCKLAHAQPALAHACCHTREPPRQPGAFFLYGLGVDDAPPGGGAVRACVRRRPRHAAAADSGLGSCGTLYSQDAMMPTAATRKPLRTGTSLPARA